MKAVLQRVTRAEVRVDGARVGAIEQGLVVLLCVLKGDDEAGARRLAERIALFRCFPDEQGRMNRSLAETHRAALVVSQITLAADGRKGRRPSFDAAAEPERARALCATFVTALASLGVRCAEGVFRAHMEVELVNDGPVTFLIEEPARAPEGPP
ncbi:MAG: D-aminoacyl-tRNA deacylase [Planctomycetota bacterium]